MDSWNGEVGFPDQFPAGIRVLAVDDDPASLRILEKLLRICKYEVTTTDEAYSALKILKENRNKYDLVISDVDMPGMDGFKLLELVGLEMNLPVIMLSAHGGYEFVMKGITLGACDYLLKPVRLEELKIIWQHVVRKNKLNFIKSKSNSENNKKENDRRSQDNEKEEEEKEEESEEDNEDSSGQKKPRVVWTSELHQKFVDAVNQLGLEKAVPKKILDLMDIEGLTRENVASHLQKFRLYLKKLNDEADQKNNSNFHMGHFEDFRDFQSLSNTRQLFSSSLSSYPLFASPSNFPGISSSRFIQSANYPSLINSASPSGKHHPTALPTFQNVNGFIPISASIEPSGLGDQAGFSFGSTKTLVGSSSGSFGFSNPLMNHQHAHESVLHGNQTSFHAASLNTSSLDGNLCSTSDFIGTASCKESWVETDKLASFSSSPFLMFQNVTKPDDNRQESNNVFKTSYRTMENMVSTDSFMMGHSNNDMVYNPLHIEFEKAASAEPKKMTDGDILFEQTRSSDGFIANSHDALDDIMKEIMKQGQNGMMSMADDLGFDAFATGSFASDT